MSLSIAFLLGFAMFLAPAHASFECFRCRDLFIYKNSYLYQEHENNFYRMLVQPDGIDDINQYHCSEGQYQMVTCENACIHVMLVQKYKPFSIYKLSNPVLHRFMDCSSGILHYSRGRNYANVAEDLVVFDNDRDHNQWVFQFNATSFHASDWSNVTAFAEQRMHEVRYVETDVEQRIAKVAASHSSTTTVLVFTTCLLFLMLLPIIFAISQLFTGPPINSVLPEEEKEFPLLPLSNARESAHLERLMRAGLV